MKRIEIKDSITREREMIYIFVLTIFISLQLKKPELWLLIPVAILLFLISLILKRLVDRQPRLVIGEKGIQDNINQQIYLWENIENIDIVFNSKSLFRFLIKSQNSLIDIDLKTLYTSPREINKAVEFFSGNRLTCLHKNEN